MTILEEIAAFLTGVLPARPAQKDGEASLSFKGLSLQREAAIAELFTISSGRGRRDNDIKVRWHDLETERCGCHEVSVCIQFHGT